VNGAAAGLTRRAVTIAPHGTLVYGSARWRDARVVIERGRIELEHLDGRRRRFLSRPTTVT